MIAKKTSPKKTTRGMKPAAPAKPKPIEAAPATETPRGRGRPKTFGDRQALILRFSRSAHRAIAQAAFDNHTTVQDLGLEAFALLFKARGWQGDIS